jgi:hypothetical protein
VAQRCQMSLWVGLLLAEKRNEQDGGTGLRCWAENKSRNENM